MPEECESRANVVPATGYEIVTSSPSRHGTRGVACRMSNRLNVEIESVISQLRPCPARHSDRGLSRRPHRAQDKVVVDAQRLRPLHLEKRSDFVLHRQGRPGAADEEVRSYTQAQRGRNGPEIEAPANRKAAKNRCPTG